MVRRRQRHVHGLDVHVGERVGAIGEDQVLVAAEPCERRDQLAGVRRGAADDAHERADADPHPESYAPRARGVGTVSGAPPAASRMPASAPRPSAPTTSPRPRSAYAAALLTTSAAYTGTKPRSAPAPPWRRTTSHGLRAFRYAAQGVSPRAKPRRPSCDTTALGSTSAPNPRARAARQKSTSW